MAAERNKVVVVDHGWNDLFAAVKSMKGEGAYAKVGVLVDSEEGGLHEEGAHLSVAEIAAVNEFGTEDGHVPARSFIRSTFDEQRESLAEMARKTFLQILLPAKGEKMTLDRALGLLGAKLAAEIKKKVTKGDGVPPPNAPRTVAAKGSSRTLVDTGRMIGAVTWTIMRGGEE